MPPRKFPRWPRPSLPTLSLPTASVIRRRLNLSPKKANNGKERVAPGPQYGYEEANLSSADARLLAVQEMSTRARVDGAGFGAHRMPLEGEAGPSDWYSRAQIPLPMDVNRDRTVSASSADDTSSLEKSPLEGPQQVGDADQEVGVVEPVQSRRRSFVNLVKRRLSAAPP
ncbi:hypothetical protein LTR27_012994 [Elasticomyces elasticus]|nr:hypothetical protein LTR27_012994 [Elasticomyces elasticus]